jgi:hypothetical protein
MASQRPLTDPERLLVRRLVEARTAIAAKMTGLVVLADLLFLLRLAARSSRSGTMAAYAIWGAVTAILAWIVWRLGWSLPRRMKRDLASGVKHELSGAITRVARTPNAYGETITNVKVGEVELVTRADIFATAREGQRVVVEYLPLSKVALMAHYLEESRA